MSHTQYMQRCLELAQMAKGNTAPNPMVGALLVNDGRVISEGWHHFYGSSHGEVNCLDRVADEDRHLIPGSTMYVSLEPCAHQGMTPPCAERIVEEGIKTVVIANKDPFAKVNGKGISILEEAGIEVITGVLEREGWWVNRRFFCFHTYNRPYVILKWAQTADGYIGKEDRSSVQISGPESMQLSHKWRTEEGAILVGSATALHDNPRLTVRLHEGKQPLRIAMDRNLQLPLTHNIFNDEAATWIINQEQETVSGNVHFLRMQFGPRLLANLLQRLHDARILSVIVEGGAGLHNSFLQVGLWDEARVFTANGMELHAGVRAADLGYEEPVHTETVGKDTLNIYTNKSTRYEYVPGMEL